MKVKEKVVRPGGFELPTFWFVARRSIQLSYGRTGFNYFSTAPFLASTTWLSGRICLIRRSGTNEAFAMGLCAAP
jgi:hypothetical protein